MFTLDGIRKFHAWTHTCLDHLLDHLATIDSANYRKELPGFGAPTLHQQVLHIVNCEAYWGHLLRNVPFTNHNPAQYPQVTGAKQLLDQVGRETLAFLAGLNNEQLNSNRELHFRDGSTALRTPAFVLHHVFTHAFHHKGQAVAMCRVLGHPAPDTDLSQFE
jgi:uncharacterized damage-inducible protein DinB